MGIESGKRNEDRIIAVGTSESQVIDIVLMQSPANVNKRTLRRRAASCRPGSSDAASLTRRNVNAVG